MRLAYFGSPEDAVVPLRALVDAGHDIALVVTQPDRRRGRGTATTPSPVKAAALELGLPVRTPEKAREVTDDLRSAGVDLAVVVAFGQLLPPSLLETVPGGFLNVHYSLLPRWRGAAPVERAILAGDAETGVCLMQIEAGLDTGPVYAYERTAIAPHETAGELRARLTQLGTELLLRELPTLATATPTPQIGEPTYAAKLEIDEFRLDPNRPASELERVVRAGNPRPGAWVTIGGSRLKVLRAHATDDAATDDTATPALGDIDDDSVLGTADGGLAFDEVQPAGKRAMPARAWRHGVRADTSTNALRVDPSSA
ncbi:MAG: methionyl-tRNA formyltransferase [Actinomycetia bacterium]|nr:methionyl-tRNA formyltransferase [Actinomycetes bacterium]